MSDTYIRVIPKNMKFVPDSCSPDEICNILKLNNIKFDNIIVNITDEIRFVDCGSNLEKIQCNHCNEDISEWWGEAMSIAALERFECLDVITPCCNKKSNLNILNYYYNVGFSKLTIDIINPSIDIDDNILKIIEKSIGSELFIISAHY